MRDAIQEYKYEEREQGAKKVLRCFAKLEDSLDVYLTGSSLALADFAVWPFVRQAMRVKPTLIKMGPKLEKWFVDIENKEVFKDLMKK